MAADDWKALLAAAPANAGRPRGSWAVQNALPAVLLGGAALAFGWIEPFSAHPDSLLGLRVTLGVYALLKLIPGQAPLFDLFNRGLERGFSSSAKSSKP